MDSDKQLVASVLERGKRRRDEDGMLDGNRGDDLGEESNAGSSVAQELGVDVAIDEGEKGPWEEPPAKLDSETAEEPSAEELEAIAADMIGIDVDDQDVVSGFHFPDRPRFAFLEVLRPLCAQISDECGNRGERSHCAWPFRPVEGDRH